MRSSRRVDDLHSLRGDDARAAAVSEKGDGITVSSVSFVAIDGHLQFLRIGQLHRFTLIRIQILHIPTGCTEFIMWYCLTS